MAIPAKGGPGAREVCVDGREVDISMPPEEWRDPLEFVVRKTVRVARQLTTMQPRKRRAVGARLRKWAGTSVDEILEATMSVARERPHEQARGAGAAMGRERVTRRTTEAPAPRTEDAVSTLLSAAAFPPCPRSRRAAARPSTSCRRCAPPSGSTGCSLRIRSFAQRSVRATPRKADPQSAREAVGGRPGKRVLASSAAMPSARASEQRERTQPISGIADDLFLLFRSVLCKVDRLLTMGCFSSRVEAPTEEPLGPPAVELDAPTPADTAAPTQPAAALPSAPISA